MQLRQRCLATALVSVFFPIGNPVSAFYLPGVVPTSYADGALVPLHVNRLTPLDSDTDFQLHSTVAYDYYHPEFHFCQPDDGPRDVSESLGSIIFGDRIKTSPFQLHMMQNETCKRLCDEQQFDQFSAKFTNNRIWQNYAINWLVDGLPAGRPYQLESNGPIYFSRGFPLGEHILDGEVQLNNHFDILIDYHEVGAGSYRVVGVAVEPRSRKDSKNLDEKTASCGVPGSSPLVLDEDGATAVVWTYSVAWRPSNIGWATRWDPYLHVEDPKIHWFSLVNSAVIVVFLVATVSAILMRALKKDIARYNRLDAFSLDDFSASGTTAEDGVQEDSGWKLVHGDVFRPPRSPLILSVLLGNGAQLFFMAGITIIFALFGVLSPSARGSLGTTMIMLYTVFGVIGGYTSARVYKTFGGDAWKRNIILTPVMIPAIVFGTFFVMNLFLWARRSSGAVPFTTMLVLVSIWFLISVPLSFLGSWLGFRRPVCIWILSTLLPLGPADILERLSKDPFVLIKSPVKSRPVPTISALSLPCSSSALSPLAPSSSSSFSS